MKVLVEMGRATAEIENFYTPAGAQVRSKEVRHHREAAQVVLVPWPIHAAGLIAVFLQAIAVMGRQFKVIRA